MLLAIINKINNDCVSKCLLHCLEQTKSKSGEALVHTKHSVRTCHVEFHTKEDHNYVLSVSVKTSVQDPLDSLDSECCECVRAVVCHWFRACACVWCVGGGGGGGGK